MRTHKDSLRILHCVSTGIAGVTGSYPRAIEIVRLAYAIALVLIARRRHDRGSSALYSQWILIDGDRDAIENTQNYHGSLDSLARLDGVRWAVVQACMVLGEDRCLVKASALSDMLVHYGIAHVIKTGVSITGGHIWVQVEGERFQDSILFKVVATHRPAASSPRLALRSGLGKLV